METASLPGGTGFVTTREFDNFRVDHSQMQRSFWESLKEQQMANAAATTNIALISVRLEEAIEAAQERDRLSDEKQKERDRRAWGLTLIVAGGFVTATIPYILKGLQFIFGVV